MRPRSDGRTASVRISAASASRSSTTPPGPACANSLLASAAPNCTEAIPPRSRTWGGTGRTPRSCQSARTQLGPVDWSDVPPTSLFPALEALLPKVGKPIQYVGGELNAVTKEWDEVAVHWALMYPDAYEVGVPNQGVQILYEVLNERPDALAERTYAVWPDLEALMREHGVGQFTVDAHRPVAAFDLLGVSFATELGYTNLLTALDLAGIPLHARDRDTEPLVVAGGHAAFNPEPVADFIDAAVLGDGEQAVGAITDIVRDWIAAGRPGGREEVLLRLARTGGVYVPRFYDVSYLPDGAHRGRPPQPRRRARAGQQAHRHESRRVALSEGAAGPDRRVGARTHVGRDLPRLHARLPVLPGRA